MNQKKPAVTITKSTPIIIAPAICWSVTGESPHSVGRVPYDA